MIQDSVNVIQESLTRVDTVLIEPRHIPVADQMLERIVALSDHLGITAEMLYDSYYTQYFLIKGVYGIALGLVLISITITLGYMFFVKYKTAVIDRSTRLIDHADLLVLIIVGISAVGFIITAIVYLLTSIPHILNPAYYATIELIRTLR